MFGNSEKESEKDAKVNKEIDDFAGSYKAELIKDEVNENKTSNSGANDNLSSPIGYVCPERLLDFVEDKPYRILDFIMLSSQKATKDEIKEIYDLFPVNDSDKKLSRYFIKEQIENFVSKNPELAKYFSEENLFYLRLITRELEVHSALKSIRERKAIESDRK